MDGSPRDHLIHSSKHTFRAALSMQIQVSVEKPELFKDSFRVALVYTIVRELGHHAYTRQSSLTC